MTFRPVILAMSLAAVSTVFAQQDLPRDAPSPVHSGTPASVGTLRITSPLGRTGLVTRVRMVAQIAVPPDVHLSTVDFFVDGEKVGVVTNGPPYAVDWTDENPFERREIVVQASDAAGHVLRDSVVVAL